MWPYKKSFGENLCALFLFDLDFIYFKYCQANKHFINCKPFPFCITIAVNLDCFDTPSTFESGGKIYPSCAKFINSDPCHCDQYRDECCASCEDVGMFVVNLVNYLYNFNEICLFCAIIMFNIALYQWCRMYQEYWVWFWFAKPYRFPFSGKWDQTIH